MNSATGPAAVPNTGSSNAARDALAQDLRALTRDAEALISSTTESAGEAVDRAREQLRSRLQYVTARLQELEQTAETAVKESARRADAAVHQHPYGAMAGAAAVGLLLGYLLSRR
jgi:ElaB/YqjD/DUF883 family membrane-anchored ribosome-binding protein